jgi:subtilisin family serine protease
MLLRNWFDLCSATVLGAALAAGCTTEAGRPVEAVDTSMAPLLAAEGNVVRDQYIVVFESDIDGVDSAMASIALKSAYSRIEHVYRVIPGFAARLSSEDLAAIRRNPAVAFVEPDQEVSIEPMVRAQADGQVASLPGSQPDYGLETIFPLPGGQPDGIDRVDQPSLPRDSQYNDHGCSGADVLAYVIDTGIRATHTELAGRVNTSRGFTAIADGNGTQDCVGQGTFLASIIAGTQFGMAKNAFVIPVRVMSCTGSGTIAGIISGINHVASDCAATDKCVATMAFGGSFSTALNNAVDSLVNSGVPVTVPVGSNGCNGSPAGATSAIGVAGVNDADCPTSGVTGACIDIYGPAVSILGASARSDTGTQTVNSTGAAAAHVAGALVQGMSCGYSGAPTTPAVCASPPGIKPLVFNDYGAESCVNRCDLPFDPLKPCQCDPDCSTFGDCCADIAIACP